MATEPKAREQEPKELDVSIAQDIKSSSFSTQTEYHPQTRWQKVQEVIWDGGNRSAEERALVQRLDIFILSWATFGYFIRLLDSGNITNAYVSGMKEDLGFKGNQYNLLSTFFTCGYLVGQIPSQFLLTRSIYPINFILPYAILTDM
jgi:ACS family pantothenate transporter-like MFS transporter